MPGAGKTTIGRLLARKIHWPYLDSDHLIEATYGRRLQDIVDATDKEGFLDIESQVVCSIRAQRLVLGTGGSVVYRQKAMQHLKSLGPIVHLDIPLELVKERIASNPERGIAIGPNQTLADIYQERDALYRQWSDFSCNNSAKSQEASVEYILSQLPKDFFL
ncbi:MAG: shikimate kinase [Desulfovibrio sp.]|nr:shikimate kinase [Desulfovibrio sp.]